MKTEGEMIKKKQLYEKEVKFNLDGIMVWIVIILSVRLRPNPESDYIQNNSCRSTVQHLEI